MCLGENEYSTMGREDNRGKEQIKFFQWDQEGTQYSALFSLEAAMPPLKPWTLKTKQEPLDSSWVTLEWPHMPGRWEHTI